MPEQIENRMVIDSEWEGVEELQMRVSNRHARRWKQTFDEIENEDWEEE